jgi:hypothetical protein
MQQPVVWVAPGQAQGNSDRTHLDFSQREKNRIQKNAVTSKPFQ